MRIFLYSLTRCSLIVSNVSVNLSLSTVNKSMNKSERSRPIKTVQC